MAEPLALVLDCGSTNVTVSAVTSGGRIAASASRTNATSPDPSGTPGWLVWDLGALERRVADACRETLSRVDADAVRGLTVTTWGADGAPVRRDGTLTHPVISWQCARTEPLADAFPELCDPFEAFAETGYQIFTFNTILKLIWLRRNAPRAFDDAHTWLMMPGLLSHWLTGEFTVDATAAGTTMATSVTARGWSGKMLGLAGVDAGLFPRWVEPGEVIGELSASAAGELDLAVGLPVVAAGHDTQFAIAGSGASATEAILSSGTWEILASRAREPALTRDVWDTGLLVEFDAEPGFTNPQFLMMGSGGLEWIRDRLFGDVADRARCYEVMIGEARDTDPGSGGVTVLPQFVHGAGPTKKHGTGAGILGLDLHTTRGQVYRAAIEGLCFQLRHALEVLTSLADSPVTAVRAVGGGSRNELWNQIRADVCGVPVVTLEQKEATVLGAAMFAFVGTGDFGSLAEARAAATVERVYEPSPQRSAYDGLYERYRALAPALAGYFGG